MNKRIPSKSQFWDFQALVKICQIPLVIFESMPVFLQILYQSLVPSNITPPYFLSPNITYFSQKQLIKVQIFETQKYLDQNSLSSGHFWNKTSVHHSSVSWDITPLYFFSWNFKYFQQKESISLHVLCYGRVRNWVINNSFALYGGGFICACRTNKTEYQWTHSQWTLSDQVTSLVLVLTSHFWGGKNPIL